MQKGKVVCCFFLTKHHAMKAYWDSGGIAPRILNLGTRWRWVVRFTPRPLYPQGKSPWYPLHRRLGGKQSRSGRGGEEKNSHPLPRLDPPIIQPVAQRYTTELPGVLDEKWRRKLNFATCCVYKSNSLTEADRDVVSVDYKWIQRHVCSIALKFLPCYNFEALCNIS
jgi:hypothetical protein